MERILGKKFTPDAFRVMEGELSKDSRMGNVAKEEAVVDCLLYPEKQRIFKICGNKNCDAKFATTYRYVNFCSDFCRREHLAETFGIEVVNETYKNRPDDLRWGGTEYPLIVPPEVLSIMKYLVIQAEEQTGSEIIPWSAPEPEPEPVPQVVPLQNDSSLSALLAEIDEIDLEL